MAQRIKAIVFQDVGKIGFGDFQLAECAPDEIVVQTLYSMVSSGTELRVLGGHYGAKEKFPLIPGYSIVGRVTYVGPQAEGFRVGDLISGRNPRPVPGINQHWGGQASAHVYTTTGEDRPVLLPADASPLDYLLVETGSISWRGVEAANPKPGETAIVLGQGLIGALSAAWLHSVGCRVIVADLEAGRLERAMKWGASAAVNIADPDAETRLKRLTNGGADIVVEASGSSKGAMLAYQLVRKKPQAYGKDYKVEPIGFYHNDWARLVMQANYLENVSIDPFNFFPGEGVTILTPMDHGVEDRIKTVELLRRKQINAANFVQNIVPFTDAASAYVKLRDDKGSNFSLAFDWTKA